MPNTFHATCRVHEDRFETDDPTLFEHHVRDEHCGGVKFPLPKLPRLRPAGAHAHIAKKPFEPTGTEVGAEIEWTQKVPTGEVERRRQWSPITRADEWVDVPVTEFVTRRGQVWSLGKRAKSVWVVPFDRFTAESEVAVLLVVERDGAIRHADTFRSIGRPQLTRTEALRRVRGHDFWNDRVLAGHISRLLAALRSPDRSAEFTMVMEAAESLGVAHLVDVPQTA